MYKVLAPLIRNNHPRKTKPRRDSDHQRNLPTQYADPSCWNTTIAPLYSNNLRIVKPSQCPPFHNAHIRQECHKETHRSLHQKEYHPAILQQCSIISPFLPRKLTSTMKYEKQTSFSFGSPHRYQANSNVSLASSLPLRNHVYLATSRRLPVNMYKLETWTRGCTPVSIMNCLDCKSPLISFKEPLSRKSIPATRFYTF